MNTNISRRGCLGMLAVAMGTRKAQAGSPIRLGLLHTLSPAPLYIAQGLGMFEAAGVQVEFHFFEAAQPIAAAAVAGDIDIGLTALTGGFYSLAGRGALKIIGGGLHEQQGFEGTAIMVSNKAFDAGLTSVDKLAGHSFGITQYGASFHYMVGRIAQAEGFDLKSVTLRPLQQVSNMLAAVRTNQVDATMAVASMARPVAEAGEAHIIGWCGDFVPYQLTALFTTPAMIATRAADLRAFCGAYQKGVAEYRAAFLRVDAQHRPIYDAVTAAAIPLISRYVFTSDPAAGAKIEAGAGWYDEGAPLDVADIRAQVAWFHAQGLVRGEIDPDAIIDTSFLPVR